MIRVETHMHTTESDGKLSPREAVKVASRRVDAVIVTDHNTFRGSIRALEEARDLGLDLAVVYGAEIRTIWGDVIVACGSQPSKLPPRDPLELGDWRNDEGCISIAAHPFHFYLPALGRRLYSVSKAIDAVEVWNATSIYLFNLPAIRAAERMSKPAVSGSDAHVASMIGVAPTLVDSSPSPDDILDSIARGKAKPVYGYSLRGLVSHFLWSLERAITGKGRFNDY